jgi:hypothetical protein
MSPQCGIWLQAADDPALFLFHENWTSQQHLDDHLARPHLQAALARLTSGDSCRAMDAVEKSLRKPGIHTLRLKLHMDHLRTKATTGHRLVPCRGCPNECGLVIIRIAA